MLFPPPKAEHEGACGIMKDLLRCSHDVAPSLLDGLFEGVKPSRLGADTLCGLAMSIENCQITLEQMEYTTYLNSLATLEKIVKQLPYALQ